MGKTCLGLNIADNVVSKGEHVTFISLEMTSRELVKRIIARRTGITLDAMNSGIYNKSTDAELVQREGGKLRGLPLLIDSTPGLTIAQIVARARRAKRQHDTKLIVVDYLGFVRGTANAHEPRLTMMEVSYGLKNLAKELDVPVLGLAQLNRNLEGRTNKRPILADIKESGSIEQDADVVMFVHREEIYLKNEKPSSSDYAAMADWEADMKKAKGRAEIVFAKQRHGETGILDMVFDGERQQFTHRED